MRILGIDYGTKKIGIALSDESGKFAFPKTIVPSGVGALRDIVDIVEQESVQEIVIGCSLDQAGKRNEIMEDIDVFVEELYKLTNIPVILQDERFSSTAVRAFDFTKPVASPRRSEKKTDPLDDRAAAIMLQRYLDKR